MVGRTHRDILGDRLLGVLQPLLNLGNDGLELGVAVWLGVLLREIHASEQILKTRVRAQVVP